MMTTDAALASRTPGADMTNLPTLLTLSRIAAIPVLVLLLYLEVSWVDWLAMLLFVAAAVTDYLDGHFARTWSQTSVIGTILDPIADKLLVGAVIMLLVALDKISGTAVLPALLILLREIMVSGLREFLVPLGAKLLVSPLAKWKTGIQMTALGFLIVGDSGPWWIPVVLIGDMLLWMAGVLTMITGSDYLRVGLRYIRDMQRPANAAVAPGWTEKGEMADRETRSRKTA
jgi:cardiolipin synthase